MQQVSVSLQDSNLTLALQAALRTAVVVMQGAGAQGVPTPEEAAAEEERKQ
jgi:hypothetical protein